MKEMYINAYAKINLILDVLGKRTDGYHDVEMIMQSLELHDQILLQEISGDEILIVSDHPFIPKDQRNLAYQAVCLLRDRYQVKTGIKITINKKIPVAAGLAGGSTDAASVLIGLNQLWDLGASTEDLVELGAKLGADVPFCIIGGTVLATGIGTDLTPITPLPELHLVLVKPEISISTRDIYSKYREDLVKRRPDLQAMLQAIKNQDIQGIKKNLVNVLEDITLYYYPEVNKVKNQMEEMGLTPVIMSGSGPTLFSFVNSEEIANKYVTELRRKITGKVIGTQTRTGSGMKEV